MRENKSAQSIEPHDTPILDALEKMREFPNSAQLPEIVDEIKNRRQNKIRKEENTLPIEERPAHMPLDPESFRDTMEMDLDEELLDPSMNDEE